ncbi:MAG: hypothetical protein A2Y33_05605 [Spirochaetes bacterium GWF1_51_8]|nr:MAG: hypothetical protein A2Y33_05605 [Spirochaetes bacterium GWF1_51_8]
MKQILFAFLTITLAGASLNAAETNTPAFGVSLNLMGAFLGMYGGQFEIKLLPWMTLAADLFYNGQYIGDDGYSMFYIGAMPRFYMIGGDLNGLWAGMGAGVKFVTIRQNGADYPGTVPMLNIAGGYKIVFGNFFVEPYGGYSFALGSIDSQPSYKGSASIYGANMGFLF